MNRRAPLAVVLLAGAVAAGTAWSVMGQNTAVAEAASGVLADVPGATLTVAGRDVLVDHVPAGTDTAALQAELAALPGVRVAEVSGGSAASGSPEASAEAEPSTSPTGADEPSGAATADVEPSTEPGAEPTATDETSPAVEQEPAATEEPAAPEDPDLVAPTGTLNYAPFETAVPAGSDDLLQQVAEYLAASPGTVVTVSGHADSYGTAAENARLADARAAAAADALVALGVDPGRIVAEGHSDTQPIASNETLEGMAANRRVEFVFSTEGGTP